MRTLDERSAGNGGHVEQISEAKLPRQDAAGDFQLRQWQRGIEKQLHGIVARLAMDIDRSGVVGSLVVLEPPIIAEPAVGFAQRDQFTRAGMLQAQAALASLIQHLGNAVETFE